MSDADYTDGDLALFVDLDQAARAIGVTPCLIGAGAIQLGHGRRWQVRLARQTLDWDFALRVDSWEQFEALGARLSSKGGGFERVREPHRFLHRTGGILDVVPYGELEGPEGTIQWPDGSTMDTTGLEVLDHHHWDHEFEKVELRTASLPALLGLKLLAYRARRPGLTRDIADVNAILHGVEESVSEDRIVAEGLGRLESEEIGFGEIGAYLLGRDVGQAFEEGALDPILDLMKEAAALESAVVGDVMRSSTGSSATRQLIVDRLRACQLGILDGRGG